MYIYVNLTYEYQCDFSSATRLSMPKAPCPAGIQHMIYCQIGGSERVPGSVWVRRLGVFGKNIACMRGPTQVEKAKWQKSEVDQGQVLARRKPRLLLRFHGWTQLRYAERTFAA